jgi:1,4-alpha-glucan branching enzyme
MSIQKKYLKTKPICKVTFKLSKKEAQDARTVHIVGGFNNWDKKQTPMKKQKNGSFALTLDLAVKQEYPFRYLIDERLWINDPTADKYVHSGFPGTDNAVIIL